MLNLPGNMAVFSVRAVYIFGMSLPRPRNTDYHGQTDPKPTRFEVPVFPAREILIHRKPNRQIRIHRKPSLDQVIDRNNSYNALQPTTFNNSYNAAVCAATNYKLLMWISILSLDRRFAAASFDHASKLDNERIYHVDCDNLPNLLQEFLFCMS
jgi:hypothetical protein